MKFCRNLQRVIDISDPEWAPYWTNYKMLKKFLKALVPPDNNTNDDSKDNSDVSENDDDDNDNINDTCVVKKEEHDESQQQQQQDDDEKEEESPPQHAENNNTLSTIPTTASNHNVSSAAQMKSNPAEVTFFKLLNSELKKAIHFFDKATIEFGIREERVREGIDIMRKTNSLMVNERWSLMARSLYRLYKDLLLLETYAIMTYCSFSKILKKHDKVTNHNTRCAFMTNVVNKANFTHYPKLLEMISRIEKLYDEVSQSLVLKGKSGLYEDERLFIGMIHKLNGQVLDTAEQEGAPDTDERKKSRSSFSSPLVQSPPGTSSSRSSMEISSEAQRSNLRSLVEENELNKSSKDGLVRVPEIEKVISSSNSDEKKEIPVEKEKKHLLVDDSLQPSAKRSKSE